MVRLGWIEVLSCCTLLILFFSTRASASSMLVLMLGEVLSRYPFLSSRRPSIAPEVSHQHLGVMRASGKSDHPLVITRLTKWRCREWQNTVRISKVWFKKRSPTSCLGHIATTNGSGWEDHKRMGDDEVYLGLGHHHNHHDHRGNMKQRQWGKRTRAAIWNSCSLARESSEPSSSLPPPSSWTSSLPTPSSWS